ncbi:uncharacterized protein Tco025E_01704 [Trypanosoma conorhini]|uniref:Uncharacterized protein n=1 Tax=Trypanosoma conorhini TaxID=83891 RepID=A0A422Q7W4_9TRYP|nr:uncharacterized protein Tco025E_01704 [Trypanosoma conorhini]RNF26075.1 hypothetical protein Tco025E_01704 [Trypanosoma conorhini]
MPAKKGKAKDSVEDNTPPGILRACVEYCDSANTPVWHRMGHLSYVHPRSGLLYVVGGCDAKALPQAIKASPYETKLDSMPFAEWWDAGTRVWGGGGGGGGGSSASSRPQTPQVVAVPRSPILVQKRQNDAEKGEEGEERRNSTSVIVGAAACASAVPLYPLQVPDGFSWPTLAATVVHWEPTRKEDRVVAATTGPIDSILTPSEAVKAVGEAASDADGTDGAALSDAPEVREHPVILFVGGWKGNCRSIHTVGVDMDRGTPLQIRGGMPAVSLPSTCLTGSAVNDCVYVFGGNTGGATGASSIMRTLDLTSRKWGERTGEEAPNSLPLPRSSHVAGVLLNRYIVIHGGRRLASAPAGTPAKGRKSIQKAPQPIEKLGLDFCNDVAVYDLEKKRWAATALPVGSLGPPPRYGHAACVLSPTELLLHGGIGVDGSVLSDAWILRLLERNEANVYIAWVKLAPPEADAVPFPSRCHHSLAAAGRRVFITGGVCQKEKVEDICIMDVEPLKQMVPLRAEGRRRTATPNDARRTPA